MVRSATPSVGCDQPSDFIDRQHVSIEVSGREQLRPNVFIHRPRSANELGPFSEDPLYFSPGAQVTKPELPIHSRPSIGLARHCASVFAEGAAMRKHWRWWPRTRYRVALAVRSFLLLRALLRIDWMFPEGNAR